MQHKLIQSVGVAWTLLYALFVIWIYATEPRTLSAVATGAQVVAGTYEVDREKFEEGLRLFRAEQFRAARDEWGRADPGRLVGWCTAFAAMIALELASQGNGPGPRTGTLLRLAARAPTD